MEKRMFKGVHNPVILDYDGTIHDSKFGIISTLSNKLMLFFVEAGHAAPRIGRMRKSRSGWATAAKRWENFMPDLNDEDRSKVLKRRAGSRWKKPKPVSLFFTKAL